jgi:hypothetical protein
LMVSLATAASVIGSTLAAAAGRSGTLFAATGHLHRGVLAFGEDTHFPGGTELMGRGRRVEILVRLSPPGDGGVATVCVKIPDLYGGGRDQDFLFASSADGAPLHHVTLPMNGVGRALYSSLWLYLAGLSPVLFGVRAETAGASGGGADFAAGEQLSFLVSNPVGSFRRVGAITLGEEIADGPVVRFAARNGGGHLRALPPVWFYRDTEARPARS